MINGYSVMRIFTDINADKDLDGFVIAGFGHSVSLVYGLTR
ncbi:Uncharacterised protein [Escherichia coli]|nr:Uncharacterised protein [Escherichia coli]